MKVYISMWQKGEDTERIGNKKGGNKKGRKFW